MIFGCRFQIYAELDRRVTWDKAMGERMLMDNKRIYNRMFDDIWMYDLNDDGAITFHEMTSFPRWVKELKKEKDRKKELEKQKLEDEL